MEGTYNDPANTPLQSLAGPGFPGRIIPSFLFDDGDASEHLFEYLNSPLLQLPMFRVDNWTHACSNLEAIFGNPSYAGVFVTCLLYGNVTRDITSGLLPANLTDASFVSDGSGALSLNLRSTYTTCLGGYCASQAECSATNVCSVGNLLTGGYELSAQGVAQCWLKLCTQTVQFANADIAGVGVRYPSQETYLACLLTQSRYLFHT